MFEYDRVIKKSGAIINTWKTDKSGLVLAVDLKLITVQEMEFMARYLAFIQNKQPAIVESTDLDIDTDGLVGFVQDEFAAMINQRLDVVVSKLDSIYRKTKPVMDYNFKDELGRELNYFF